MQLFAYKMEYRIFCFNELRECCYVVWDETGECVIIDPGFNCDSEFERLKKFIAEKGLKPVKILLTHAHFDHIWGLEDITKFWDLPVYYSFEDGPQFDLAIRYAQAFGYDLKPFTGRSFDLKDGDKVTFGKTVLDVLATPGHTPGGLCFLDKEEKVVFTGDTLFYGSIGRTDHIGGNCETLIKSINDKLMPLDGDIRVCPGHGNHTDIGYERATNPFIIFNN